MSVVELLDEIADIGRDPDSEGYHRFTYTKEDHLLRGWFCDQASSRDFRTETDRNGNLWATRGSGPYIATGSHLDSVPDGGAFDGPLGIATAFAAIDLLDQSRDVAVVAFAEEEGARFGVACLGSRLLTGAIEPERARRLVDREGMSLAVAMEHAGIDASRLGPEPARLQLIDAFVELHVEQGRGLADLDSPLGLADSIWPHGRWRLDFHGTANHAGTTSMENRRDPMVEFTQVALATTARARSAAARATFGRVEVFPNATNAIPSRVTAWLDARAATEEALSALLESLPGESLSVTNESISPAVVFDAELRESLAIVLEGIPSLPTAAGHDAGVLAAKVPTSMIFVRNPTGVSHSPHEFADPDDCEAGAEALSKVIAVL